ncbi:MAG: IclR family transcriptional regulator [Thermovirgaceae bacterium]|nr:IclR family transcriptional regulator [Thermovirgaceae bacterium]
MERDTELVQSVLKAVLIMERLDSQGAMGTREIAQVLGLGKSSAHRIVKTLKHAGWVVENSSNGKNELSWKLFSVGSKIAERMSDRELFHNTMEKLAEETGESVNLGILFRGEVLHIDKVESKAPIKADASLGGLASAYNTALGKVLLAGLSEDQVVDLYGGYEFVKTARNTILSLESLIAELRGVRDKGYACDNEEFADGLVCYAVPVRNRRGQMSRALSVSFPKYRCENRPEKIDHILESLKKAGEMLTG